MGRSTSTAAARRLGVLWLGLLGAGLPAHSLTDPRWPGPIASVRPDPGPRNAHGLAYDLEAGVLVLFGGATADEVRGDTWHWRAGTWRQASYHGPPPGTFPSMVYDSARAEVVLFGGNRVLFGDDVRPPAMLGDTWVWRGGAWALAAQAGPAPRAEAAMAYDPLRRRAVLFGGYRMVKGQIGRLGDTWEWDGTRWSQTSVTGPSPRSGASMAYDPSARAVLLFGGSGGACGRHVGMERSPVAAAPSAGSTWTLQDGHGLGSHRPAAGPLRRVGREAAALGRLGIAGARVGESGRGATRAPQSCGRGERSRSGITPALRRARR